MLLADLIEQRKGLDTIFVVAGGPSLDMVDRSALSTERHAIIVCNTAYKLYPTAMLAHHADYSWWKAHGEHLINHFKGEHITGTGMEVNVWHYPPELERLDYIGAHGIPSNLHSVSGVNSGQQGLSLAHLFEPRRIVLLGFDHTRAPSGQSHWNGADPLTQSEAMDKLWLTAMKWFHTFAANRQKWWTEQGRQTPLPTILNVSPISAIKEFERADQLPDDIL
jgi:hypothetical protein